MGRKNFEIIFLLKCIKYFNIKFITQIKKINVYLKVNKINKDKYFYFLNLIIKDIFKLCELLSRIAFIKIFSYIL